MKYGNSKKVTDMRERAEEALRGHTANPQDLSTGDLQSLIHELQVHQIELEMQNEELRRAQRELEESRNRYSDLYDFAPIGYFTFDKNGLILTVNLTGAKKLGVERSFLIKKPFSLYIVPDSKDVFYLHLRKVFGTNIRQTCEIKLVDKNGIQFDARLESLPVQDAEGNLRQCRTAISDITVLKAAEETLRQAAKVELEQANKSLQTEIIERRWAEDSLAEQSKTLESFFEHTITPMVFLDRNFNFIRVNEAYARACKRHVSEFPGHNHFEFYPHEENMAIFREVVKTKLPYMAVAKPFTFPDHPEWGVTYWDWTLTPVLDNTGEVRYLVFSLNDVTGRVRGVERIREQAALLDRAQDAIGVRDMEHRLIYWNKGAERMYGFTKEEAIGKNADELLYKEETPQLIEAKRRAIEDGEWIGELHQVTKQGKEIIVESRWTLMRDNEGKPKSILIINTDITEKKKLEAQFLRAQRLESIGTLASGITHDLNNVLTPIMLSLQILQEKVTDEASRKLINILQRNTERGASLIKQVQSFARGIESERSPLRVADSISEIRQIIMETFPRSVEIRTNVSGDLYPISGNATQMNQVLMNLCVNARDAMPDGGVLEISAENIFIDENNARMNIEARVGRYVVITVSDTGTGILPEILDRIFEPFFTTKQPGKGTGLGLSTVHAILKSHGGFVNVDSRVGKGTSFKVYLPAIQTTEIQKIEEQNDRQAGKGETILVVDDEAPIREVTGAVLGTNGYRVITASDGAEAVIAYTQNRQDVAVVIMDMMMPVMDGVAGIRELRKINPRVKIIAVSGLADKDRLEKVKGNSIQAFLFKPYTGEKLLKTVSEVLMTK